MADNRNFSTFGRLYGILVLKKRRALYAEDNPDNLPVVPDRYVEDVLNYLEYIAQLEEEREKREKEKEPKN